MSKYFDKLIESFLIHNKKNPQQDFPSIQVFKDSYVEFKSNDHHIKFGSDGHDSSAHAMYSIPT